jgi:hypothetical protein
MKTKFRVLSVIAAIAVIGISYYFTLPPINIHSIEFWNFLLFSTLLILVATGITKNGFKLLAHKIQSSSPDRRMKVLLGELRVVPIVIIIVALAVPFLGNFVSSTFFNAKSYSEIITVKDAIFEDDMVECETVTNIALMDSASAAIIGNRTLGSLSQVVSQYEISGTYTQINFKDTPKKVANLEYADFFRWFNNKSKGIPGYVMVDPVNNSAEYVESSKPMVYAQSGYLGDYLLRKLRFSYPTKIFDRPKFEVDEKGDPKYIVPCMTARVMLFGAMDVEGVIIFDPCTGNSEYFKTSEVPSWVDIVYDGNLAIQKYNWKGMLSGGYWNSVIGNVDCKIATDDFGYIVIEDDVWYFTGVTSITSDESNIGFILTNARTAEYKYYPVVGAEEYSAMHAAEGEVQEKGYVASFPSLINVSGEATYIMVLKDSGGLVKLYALVNVENYSIVTTGTTQTEALAAYKKKLAESGILSDKDVTENTPSDSITVKDVRIILMDNVSVAYITSESGLVYKKAVMADESLMLISAGDKITVYYAETQTEGIREIISWEKN